MKYLKKTDDYLPLKTKDHTDRKEQLRKEIDLLKKFDPDAGLKREFETASLNDLQKYPDE